MLIVLLLTGLFGTTPLDGLGHPQPSVRESATQALWAAGPEAEVWLERGLDDPRPEVRRRARHIRFMLDHGLTPDMPPPLLESASAFFAIPPGMINERQRAARRLVDVPGGATVLAASVVEGQDLALAMLLEDDIPNATLRMLKRGDHDSAFALLELISEVKPAKASSAMAVLCTETGKPVPPRFVSAVAKQHLLTFEAGDDPEPLRRTARKLATDPEKFPLTFMLRYRVGDAALALDVLPFPYNRLLAVHDADRRGDADDFDRAVADMVAGLNRGLRANDAADALFLGGRIEEAFAMQEPNIAYELGLLRQRGDVRGLREALVRARNQVGLTARGGDELQLAWAALRTSDALDDTDQARRWLAAIGNGGARPRPNATFLGDMSEDTERFLFWLYEIQPERAVELLESLHVPESRMAAAAEMMSRLSPLAVHGAAYWMAFEDDMPISTRLELLEAVVLGTAPPDVVSAVADALAPGIAKLALLDAYERHDQALASAEQWAEAEPGNAEALLALSGHQDGAAAVGTLERAFVAAQDADLAAAIAFELARRSAEPEKWEAFVRLLPLGEPGPALRAAAGDVGPEALLELLGPARRMAVPFEYASYDILNAYADAADEAGAHAEAAATYDDMAIYLHVPTVRFTRIEGFISLYQERRTQAALAKWEAGDIDAALPLAVEAVRVPGGAVDVTIFWLRKFDEAGLGDLADEVYAEQMGPMRGWLEQMPDEPLIGNRAAWLSGSVDRSLDDALDWAMAAHRASPDSTSIRDTVAEVLVRRGEWRAGLDIFEQIVAEEPFVGQHRVRLDEARAVVVTRIMRMLPG
ncbi:MAG: hypothetical protein AAGD32_10260 [Planctomycetota bacterium]